MGELQISRGGASQVLPLQEGVEEKVLSMLKGGTKRFGVVLTLMFLPC